MLTQVLRNPHLPVPADLAGDMYQDTAVAVITSPDRQAVALVCPVRDPTRQTIMFVQGRVQDEAVYAAVRREVREEIPSLARPSKTSSFRVLWDSGRYLGSVQNPKARSGVPKRLHFFVMQATVWTLQPDGVECRDAFWVYDPGAFSELIKPVQLANPTRHAAICAAIVGAQEAGFLL